MFGKGLLTGLRVTSRRMVGRPQCDLYPYNPKVLPTKSRTFLSMFADTTGVPACKACMTCQNGCPDHVIRIERDPEDRKKATSFTVDSGRCTFCGICEESCPYDALVFTGDFERATFDKDSLTYRLIEEGKATSSCVTTAPSPAEDDAPAGSGAQVTAAVASVEAGGSDG